jgi:hypothetical protein
LSTSQSDPQKPPQWRRLEQVVWAFVAAVTVVGAFAGTLDILGWVERLLSTWRVFMEAVWRNLFETVPEFMRPYWSPAVSSLLTLTLIFFGALLRSEPRPDTMSLKGRAARILPAAIIYLILMTGDLGPEGLWGREGAALLGGVLIFSMLTPVFLEWGSKGFSFGLAEGVIFGLVLAVLVLYGAVIALLGTFPDSGEEWRVFATCFVVAGVAASVWHMLAERQTKLLWQVLAIAGAILCLGLISGIVEKAFVEAGWPTSSSTD